MSLAVADRDGIRFIHQATRRRAMSLSFRIGDLLNAGQHFEAGGEPPPVDRVGIEYEELHVDRAQALGRY